MPSNPSSIADEAEAFVRQQAAELTRPGDDECLCCYVARQLEEFHCDGSHRHALRYRDAKAPRATGLLANLRRVKACAAVPFSRAATGPASTAFVEWTPFRHMTLA